MALVACLFRLFSTSLSLSGGIEGPKYVLLFNVVITVIGILLAIFVNMRYKNESKIATK